MATTTEGSQTDSTPYWVSPGGETRLEESMWKLGLGGSGESGESYPERPNEADCIYYLKTGYCGYGSRCRFNHPRDRGKVLGSVRPSAAEYPERAGQPVCQYYMRTGTCKFGASCKYHHPKAGGGSSSPPSLNYYGYPLRPGEQECSYYVRTGHCKFGATCKFHHPEPVGMQGSMPQPQPQVPQIPAAVHPPTLYQSIQTPAVPSSQPYGVVVRPTYFPGHYVGSYGPALLPPGMVPFPSWAPYPAPVSPMASPGAQPAMVPGPFSGITQLSSSAPSYTGPYQSIQPSAAPSGTSQREHSLPQRPGQQECQYYIKTGECKYGSSCRYHHPLEVIAAKGNVVAFNPVGLPLRPGAPVCTHYAQHGTCKFGAACRFDHPIESLTKSPSSSSFADMSVVPFSVGSAVATLVPSASSSLRPETASGSNVESIPTKVSLSMSTSSESIGSIFSSSGSAPQSSVLQSVPGTSPSTSSMEAYSSS